MIPKEGEPVFPALTYISDVCTGTTLVLLQREAWLGSNSGTGGKQHFKLAGRTPKFREVQVDFKMFPSVQLYQKFETQKEMRSGQKKSNTVVH